MNLFFRLIVLTATARLRGRLDPLATCRTPFRVLPTDLDLLGHMNNGVYFSVFDLARVDLMLRCGLLPQLKRRGWYPVVTAETASFRRSLNPFRRFVVATRILGWDERALYLEHRVLRGERLVTSAVIQARFLSRSGERIAPQRIADLLPGPPARPELPEWVVRWSEHSFAHTREAAGTAAGFTGN